MFSVRYNYRKTKRSVSTGIQLENLSPIGTSETPVYMVEGEDKALFKTYTKAFNEIFSLLYLSPPASCDHGSSDKRGSVQKWFGR
jgi:hypothetical protein